MKIYLAGAISPQPRWLSKLSKTYRKYRQEKNLFRFYQKANELRDLGHEVFNPPEGEPPFETWTYYLAEDIKKGFLDFKPDTLYAMKNWQRSGGARLEVEMAKQLNIPIVYETF